jgi:hypothetical protein
MSPLKAMKFTLVWARTFPPSESEGWTVHFIERESRDWIRAQAGLKDEQLFATSVEATLGVGQRLRGHPLVYRWRKTIWTTIVESGQCLSSRR